MKKASAGAKETAPTARERLNKILEEEKKQEREAKLKDIMRQQKAELKKTVGGGSEDDSDENDSDDDSDEDAAPARVGEKSKGAKAEPASSDAKKKQDAMNYFMQKAGKEVEE